MRLKSRDPTEKETKKFASRDPRTEVSGEVDGEWDD